MHTACPKNQYSMGGHSAWRKRVERGDLAKGYAGAICRHRPHLGRTGKDLNKNRKGNIGGGNPKKLSREFKDTKFRRDSATVRLNASKLLVWFLVLLSTIVAISYTFFSPKAFRMNYDFASPR
jgi:hypothetical protein